MQQTWSWQTGRCCHTFSGKAWDQNLPLESKNLDQILVARVHFHASQSLEIRQPVLKYACQFELSSTVIFSVLEISEWLIIRKCLRILSLFSSNLKVNLNCDHIVKHWNKNREMKIQYLAQLHFWCVTLNKSLNLCFASFLSTDNKPGLSIKQAESLKVKIKEQQS